MTAEYTHPPLWRDKIWCRLRGWEPILEIGMLAAGCSPHRERILESVVSCTGRCSNIRVHVRAGDGSGGSVLGRLFQSFDQVVVYSEANIYVIPDPVPALGWSGCFCPFHWTPFPLVCGVGTFLGLPLWTRGGACYWVFLCHTVEQSLCCLCSQWWRVGLFCY